MNNPIPELSPVPQPGFGNLSNAREAQLALVEPTTYVLYSTDDGSRYQPDFQTIILKASGEASLSQPGDPLAVRIERGLQMVGVLTEFSEFASCDITDIVKGDRLVFMTKEGELASSKPVSGKLWASTTGQSA